jgi:hypothetical protein
MKKFSHTRTETDKEIIIRWHPIYLLMMYLFFLLVIIGFLGSYMAIMVTGLTLLVLQMIYSIIYMLPANKEIKAASQMGKKITVEGKKYSFKNPLTVTIKK